MKSVHEGRTKYKTLKNCIMKVKIHKLAAKGRVIYKLSRIRPAVQKLLTLWKIPSLQELLHKEMSE